MWNRRSRARRDRIGQPRRQPRPLVEPLEGRQLLAAATVYPAHLNVFYQGPLTLGPDGNLWFPESGTTPLIGRITPVGAVTEFPIPAGTSDAGPLTVGPDGVLWFPEGTPFNSFQTPVEPGGIGRITTSGALTIFPTPSTATPGVLTVAPDGNLWFPESGYGKFGRVTPSGVVTEFALPPGLFTATALTVGPDGNLWLNATPNLPDNTPNSVVRITLAGAATAFPIPTSTDGSTPGPLTVAPDGNLWFGNGDVVDRVTPSGVITGFPGFYDYVSVPLTVGPDGALWSDEGIDILRVSTSGVVTTFTIKLPPNQLDSFLSVNVTSSTRMTVGPDGDLYVTGDNVQSFTGPLGPGPMLFDPVVYQVTPSGAITAVPVSKEILLGHPGTATVGGDGAIWFPVNGNVGRVDPAQIASPRPLTVTPGAPSALSGVPFSGVLATFSDPDHVNGPANYTATVHFGNGPAVPGVVALGLDGDFTVSAAHTFPLPGSKPFMVTITGPTSAPVTANGQLTVTPSNPVVTANTVALTADVASTQTYATFPNPYPGSTPADFLATIAFGDGQTAPGVVAVGPNATYLVSAAHTYAEPGTRTFIVTVTGPSGAPIAALGQASVTAPNPALKVVPVTVTAGLTTERTYATFAAPFAGATAADYSATVNFGDGQTAPGVTSPGPNGVLVVSATHSYARPGTYRPTVTVLGLLGGVSDLAGLAVVVPPPSVIELQRLGVHLQPTRLVLTFNRPMNAATVQNARNYLLYPIDPNGFARPFVQPIPLVSAVYDPVHQTVTLTPRSRLALSGYYLLTVNGAGAGQLMDVTGVPLVGTNAGGLIGSDYIAVVHGYGPMRPATSSPVGLQARAMPSGPRHPVLPTARR